MTKIMLAISLSAVLPVRLADSGLNLLMAGIFALVGVMRRELRLTNWISLSKRAFAWWIRIELGFCIV